MTNIKPLHQRNMTQLQLWLLALTVPLVLMQSQFFSVITHHIADHDDVGSDKGITHSSTSRNASLSGLPMVPSIGLSLVSNHIVVAHCKEDLSWLNQLRDYDPSVCQQIHIHIYSKCGAHLDLEETISSVSECATLHRLVNYGTEEYAYFTYIQDMYDSLPSMVSFIQGGALTENPHIIHDILGPNLWLPGLTYRSLSRYVQVAWHMIDYEKEEKKGDAEIMTRYAPYLFNMSSWITGWRGMYTVSSAQIRQHPWKSYSFIHEKILREECFFRNCYMEMLFSSLFGCNTHLFEDESSCTSGVYANLSLVVLKEDYWKDTYHNNSYPAQDYKWKQCGNKTLLYSESGLNGDLICLNNPNFSSAKNIRHYLEELMIGDRIGDLSNQTFQKASQWLNHAEIFNAQK